MYYRGGVQKNCYIVTFRLFDIQNPYISTVFGVTVFVLVRIAQKPAKSDKSTGIRKNPIPVQDAEVLSGLVAYFSNRDGRIRPSYPFASGLPVCSSPQSPGAHPCTSAYDPLYPLYQGSQCRQGDNHRRN